VISQSLILALLSGQTAAECPAVLMAKGYGVSRRAQAYADCVSRPSLPVATDLAKKKRQCSIAEDGATSSAVAWVDTIAANFPGCETRLEFKKK
jgi:hypothetical protein